MSSKAYITLNKFISVKTLIESGANDNEIENFLHISRSTIARIKKAETFEEYKQIQAAYNIAIRKKEQQKEQAKAQNLPAEKPEAPAPAENPEPQKSQTSTNYQTIQLNRVIDSQNAKLSRIIEIMQKQNELLTTISAKIAFVVDELTR